MPYMAQWDALNGMMIVGGTLTPGELPAFLRALQEAVGMCGAPTKSTDPIGPAQPGPPQLVPDRLTKQSVQANNWRLPFMELAVRADKMIFAIKFWRIISGQGLKEAKEYVVEIQKGGIRGPVGNEFPNVSKEDLAWAHEVLARIE